MYKFKIIFSGLSKNCLESTKKNVYSIIELRKNYKDLDVEFYIVDSDSNDGTKEYLFEISKQLDFIKFFNLDGLEEKFNSRIERIAECRNICIQQIQKTSTSKELLYIPMDLDINLFEITDIEKFYLIMENFTSQKNIDALFPVSEPFYYDIFALRAKGWINFNSQLIVNSLKRFFLIGSFFINYLFIFRYQWSSKKISRKDISIISAFGGMGIYKIYQDKVKQLKYITSEKNTDYVSEHISFNKNFENLKMDINWKIPAPSEHVMYKALQPTKKINYFLKTVKSDLKNNLFNFFK